MKNKGSSFEIKICGKDRYFISSAVSGLADFVQHIRNNAVNAAGEPRSISERIPQAEELSETAWRKMADDTDGATRFSCVLILDFYEDRLWVNEDLGDGMGGYVFPFSEVLKLAGETTDLWPCLLERFPSARVY